MPNATIGDIGWIAHRMNAKPDTIRRYYGKTTVEEVFEGYQQRRTDSLDINDEPA